MNPPSDKLQNRKIIIKGKLTCKCGEILVLASHHKEKRGGGGQGNLLSECIQQNRRAETAISGEWRDTAGRCQETRLRVLSWNWGSHPGGQKARERQGPASKKKWGKNLYWGGRKGSWDTTFGAGLANIEPQPVTLMMLDLEE